MEKKKFLSQKILIIFVWLAFLFTGSYVQAQKTWLGLTSDWHTDSNWDPSGTPIASDAVNIPTTSNDPDITAGATAKSVVINASVTLIIQSAGTLFVEGSTDESVTNNGSIINFGQLNVSNSGDVGILNIGTFSNELNAIVNVDNTQTWGIASPGNITNKGTINIGLNGSIGGRGLQNGHIEIGMLQSGTALINEVGATINIDNTGGDAIYNVTNYFLNNKGSIVIGNSMDTNVSISVGGIFNGGDIQNYGLIEIDNVSSNGITNLSGVFNNEQNANIEITNSSTGILLNLSSTFINKSNITLREISIEGIAVVNSSSFLNDVGGLITIDDIQGRGIAIWVDALFTNNGIINIGNNDPIGGHGLRNQSGFVNEEGGIVTISQTASEGIYNISTSNTTNTFTNKGTIMVNPPTTSSRPAIYNNSTLFHNEECAELQSTGIIFNPGTIQNDGIFTSNGLFTSNNSFINNGLFNYLSGSFSTGNTTNNEIIIDPSTGTCSGLSPAFDLGNGGTFEILGVYTDQTLQNPAGTYDQNTNTFACNLAPGEHTLYVEVKDGDTDCSYIAIWKVIIEADKALPPGWESSPSGIDCANGNEASFDSDTQTFILESEGCYDPNYYSNSDAHGFIYTELCGDGEIIAEIQSVSGDGWAGVSMRESNDPGAKMIQLLIDGVFLTQRQMRTSTGGYAFKHQFQTQGRNWLKLTRSGSTFGAYHSLDGINWSAVLVTNLSMNNCISIGLVTMNKQASGAMTAVFGNVAVISNPIMYSLNNQDAMDIDQHFSVYPNPVSEMMWLDLGNYLNQKVQISLFNQLGQKVIAHSFKAIASPTQELNVSPLIPGAYWVELKTDTEREVLKVVVE